MVENESAFSEGWSFIGRRRDDFDSEWESFVDNTRKYIYWYICHVLLSEIVRQIEPHVSISFFSRNQFENHRQQNAFKLDFNNIFSPLLQRLYFVHATIGISFVCANFKPLVAASMFIMVFSYFVAMLLQKRYVWALTVIWLAVLNMLKQSMWEDWLSSVLNEKEVCDAMIALSWLLLRVTSFALDFCNARMNAIGKRPEQGSDYFSTLHYLSYSFYLPVYLHGPPLIYERYGKMFPKNQLHRLEEAWHRLKEFAITLLRIACIYCLNEFCMHFIYANVIIYNADVSVLDIFHVQLQEYYFYFFSNASSYFLHSKWSE